MSHPSRRFLCRLGFVLLCVLPTLSVGGWVMRRSFLSGGVATKPEWERELTARLGLVAALEAVEYPRPGVALLGGVRLLDPETGRTVAELPALEIEPTLAGWRVTSSPAQIELAALSRAWPSLEQRLFRGPQAAATTAVEWKLGAITLAEGDERLTLQDVSARYAMAAERTELEIVFGLPPATSATTNVKLHIARTRGESPSTTWQLDTGGTALPCRLVAGFVPVLAGLGDKCQFAGQATATNSAADISGTLSGDFLDVELDSLVTERFPHRLSGLATLHLEQAALVGGKLVALRGRLDSPSGAISPSLLAAAEEHLGLNRLATGDTQSGTAIPFYHLSLAFALDGDSLCLSAAGPTPADRVLLSSPAGPLLQAPLDHHVPAIQLLRTLLPERDYQVPAARQTAALVNLLPLPEFQRDVVAEVDSHVPTRLSSVRDSAKRAPVIQPMER